MGSSSASGGFNLFTHQQKRQKEGTGALVMDYPSLKEAILELYLSVKIRSDDEIDAYNKNQFEIEKKALKEVNGYELIDNIKTSIEALMNMKIDDSSCTTGGGQNEFDLDGDIEIDLPAGAKAGLKDASQDIRLGTD